MADVTNIVTSDATGYQRREWVVERVWWAVLAVLLLAAVAGVFGGGPVSKATVGSADAGAEITYERLTRTSAPTSWMIHVPAVPPGDEVVHVHIEDALIERMSIDNITPAPAAQTSTREGVRFTFRAEPASSPTIRIGFRPTSMGLLDGAVGVGAGPELGISMFAYP